MHARLDTACGINPSQEHHCISGCKEHVSPMPWPAIPIAMETTRPKDSNFSRSSFQPSLSNQKLAPKTHVPLESRLVKIPRHHEEARVGTIVMLSMSPRRQDQSNFLCER
jgi:hypothetical protein